MTDTSFKLDEWSRPWLQLSPKQLRAQDDGVLFRLSIYAVLIFNVAIISFMHAWPL